MNTAILRECQEAASTTKEHLMTEWGGLIDDQQFRELQVCIMEHLANTDADTEVILETLDWMQGAREALLTAIRYCEKVEKSTSAEYAENQRKLAGEFIDVAVMNLSFAHQYIY